MLEPFDQKKTIPEVEAEILRSWQEEETFAASYRSREGNQPFVFYEGPPTANGRPGIHHVIARTFKDVICRFQTMKGKFVLRKAGWDTHGLPVELQVEKALGLKNKQDIERYGVAEFNRYARESVWQYKEEWVRLTERMGYWVDLKDPYITYDRNYIESVWWGLKQIWDKGYVYQDYKVVPYCPRCGTALSLAEVAQGYKEVTETSVYVKFELVDESNSFILAWTTTPWTLPGNVALAVGPKLTYVQIKQNGETYYLAKDRLSVLAGEYELVNELSGQDLVGKRYRPLFEGIDLAKESGKEAYHVLPADFVTTEDGTGVVHTAVMYGEDDFNLGKSHNLPAVHTVSENGEFNKLVPAWQGRFVKEAEADITASLQSRDRLYKTEQTTHTYPFCWRCGTPLLYYARSSWFIRIDQPLRDRLVKLNSQVDWIPDHLRDGRFGNWLAGLRDWAISRERYWGTPLPIWICQNDENHRLVIGSYQELSRLAKSESKEAIVKSDFDPHKPFIDGVLLDCAECGGTMKRVPEVLDVWFDSGAMPFAQWHYPFENQDRFRSQFPADFIAEGIDQTRGWFNSLLILAALIFDEKSYRSVISVNLVLDKNGQKMSKSKGNVVDPWEVMEKTGVDALRFYFLAVNQPGDYKNFSAEAVGEYYRKVVMIWWNVTNFFLTYAALDNWTPGRSDHLTVLDRWILSLTNQAGQKIDRALLELDTFTASRTLAELIDGLSTWYLRRSRKRRDAAFYSTLHMVLLKVAHFAAPMMPFVAEATYRSLKTSSMPTSVHLADWPAEGEVDEALLKQMATLRQLVTLGHAARASAKLKVRQPLARAIVSAPADLAEELLEILKEELNVESIEQGTDKPAGWLISEEGELSVRLDPQLSPELKEKGLLREVVRALQDLRKKAGCQPGQPVVVTYSTDSEMILTTLSRHRTALESEVSAAALAPEEGGSQPAEWTSELTFDGQSVRLGLRNAP